MTLLRTLSMQQLLWALLLFITLFALLPWQPQGPFDARDWSLIEGVEVTMPWWQMLIEPFSAFGHIIIGAPDFRLAAISTAIWLALLTWLWVFLRSEQALWWRRGLWASVVSLFALWCVPAAIVFYSFIHFPGWQLQLADPQWLAADLQTHTLGSHDGMVRADYNLRWHQARGYDVIGMTEHDETSGSFYAEQLAQREGGPLVIPGVEMVNEYDGFLLGVGLKPDQPVLYGRRADIGYSKRFAENLHRDHQAALISLAWQLDAASVEKLADDGVDAFELVNAGHPDIPDTVRNEMLRLEREGRIRLVSSSDWHGWGGYSRTWTLLRVPGQEQMSDQQKADYIVTLLREGSREEVVPLAAGYQGEQSMVRKLFSPLVETARYAAELSPSRLLGWWLWAVVLWLLARRLRESGLNPARLLWSACLFAVAGLLLWKGVTLQDVRPQGDVILSDITAERGLLAMQVAVPLLLAACWLVFRAFRDRQDHKR